MDFKITGTRKGFTALQVDIKLPGIPLKIVMESITRATKATCQILGIMDNVISSPRTDNTDYKPLLESIEIPVHQRGKFLGVGGSNLKKIFMETGVHVRFKRKDINLKKRIC